MRLIDGMQRFLAFDLDDYLSVNHQICSKAALQLHSSVNERDGLLSLHVESYLFQFVGQTGFIGRLKDAGAQPAMNVDGGSDDL